MTSAPEVWAGGRVSPRAACVLGPNAGVMTLDGTNTWVLREPGAARAVVVDPGPLDGEHLDRVLLEAGDGGVAVILLTHHHLDHAESAARLAELTGAPVRGGGHGPALEDGERVEVDGLRVRVAATPGHTADSVCLHVPQDRLLLTGDTLLGRGSTIVPWPEGDLRAYLSSLDRLLDLTAREGLRRVGPGHGPVLSDPAAALTEAREHRLQRLAEIGRLLDAGTRDVDAVVRAVYGPVEGRRLWACRSIVRSQLAYLGVDVAG
ncbi:MBL fold metallo-hydrolase [Georgenia sp. AZ-5]|uniref:MBL fold metallo-hydrolase n=1 Tax=Georgenia sp. AZ-5 TaxID=3367526 RepID=UPI003753F6D4